MSSLTTAALCLLLAAPAAAQQQVKAVVLVRERDDGWRLVSALDQAVALKKAGAEVRLVFEGEAVLMFLAQRRGEVRPELDLILEEDGVELSSAAKHERMLRLDPDYPFQNTGEHPKKKKEGGKPGVAPVRKRMFHRAPDPRRDHVKVSYARPRNASESDEKFAFRNVEALDAAVKEVPYTVCAFSAELFGVSGELAAAGRPLSPDPDQPVDLSGYVKDGYSIYVY